MMGLMRLACFSAALLLGACSDSGPGTGSGTSTAIGNTPSVSAPDAAFAGKIGTTLRDSEPDYLTPAVAHAGTPNIVIVLVDDIAPPRAARRASTTRSRRSAPTSPATGRS